MVRKLVQIRKVGVCLVVGFGLFAGAILCAGPTDPVTIHVTVRYVIPSSEVPARAIGTLTLYPGPPARTALQFEWDSSTRNSLVPLLEEKLAEWPRSLTAGEVTDVQGFLTKFYSTNGSDHGEVIELSSDGFQKLRDLYAGKEMWEVAVQKETDLLTFPIFLDRKKPLEILTGPRGRYYPMVPVREAEYDVVGGEARLREETFHHSLFDLAKRHKFIPGVELAFYPFSSGEVVVPVYYLGRNTFGEPLVANLYELKEFRFGHLASLPLYSVDARTLGNSLGKNVVPVRANAGRVMKPWKTHAVTWSELGGPRDSLLETLRYKVENDIPFSVRSICRLIYENN